jgi:chaperone BCS1
MSDSSFVEMERGVASEPRGLLDFETDCFDATRLKAKFGLDAEKSVWFEIKSSGNRLYKLCLAHIGRACEHDLQSFVPIQTTKCSGDDLFSDEHCTEIVSDLGLGYAEFEHAMDDGKRYLIKAVHQRRGPVVGTNCGPTLYINLILFVEGRHNQHVLKDFCKKLIDDSERTRGNNFTIFRWNVEHGYWNSVARKTGRSVDSVVLPDETKDKLIKDLDKFLSRHTYDFYTKHGIPYKRSYLFYGVPGAGKTSLLQAIAAKYRRNLCFMQPTDPKFTDDALQDAINDAPGRALIVLEDVDALFGADRSLSNQKMSITFTGLLNALDGVANAEGQIFFLTTNFREKLDSALIRNGRVDMHVEFTYAQPEQMATLFLQFYPEESQDTGKRFSDAVVKVLDGKEVNMAALQHYFIGMMERTAEEAIAGVASILEDLKEKDATVKNPDEKVDDAKEDKNKKEGKKEGKKKAGRKAKQTGGASNIHIHIHAGGSASSSSSDDGEDEGEQE